MTPSVAIKLHPRLIQFLFDHLDLPRQFPPPGTGPFAFFKQHAVLFDSIVTNGLQEFALTARHRFK